MAAGPSVQLPCWIQKGFLPSSEGCGLGVQPLRAPKSWCSLGMFASLMCQAEKGELPPTLGAASIVLPEYSSGPPVLKHNA